MLNDTGRQISDSNKAKKEILGLNIRKLENDVIGYLKNITGDMNLALDLAQESILKCLEFLSQDIEISRLKPYVLRVGRNLAIDYYRKFGKRIDLVGEELDKQSIQDSSEISSPEFLLLEKEEKVVISKAFAKLKISEREILSLYYYNELNLKEISELLEIPVNTAITKLCRARRELKRIILKGGTYEMP